jgi:hypothetical protein
MDANQKSWAWGCGCGCLTAIPAFLATYGLAVLSAYLIWEYGDVRSDFFEGPAALVWGGFLGLCAGGVIGLIATFIARSVAKKRALNAERDLIKQQNQPPPKAPPPQQPPQQPPFQPPPQY